MALTQNVLAFSTTSKGLLCRTTNRMVTISKQNAYCTNACLMNGAQNIMMQKHIFMFYYATTL